MDCDTITASYATVNNVNFATAQTVSGWEGNTNTVNGSGNTNLTIDLGGTVSASVGNGLTYGETLKDDMSIIVNYSLRGQNATLIGSTENDTIYDAGSQMVNVDVSAAGYTFSGNQAFTQAPLTFTVNPAVLTVTAGEQTLTYGDSADSTSYHTSGWVSGVPEEDLGELSFTGTYSSAGFLTAGTEHRADGSNLQSSSGNYTIDFIDSAIIVNQLELTHNLTVDSKIYDNTTDATCSGDIIKPYAADNVVMNASYAFDTRHTGTDKDVSVTASLTGADAANYKLPVFALKGDITPKTIYAADGFSTGKIYDGTVNVAFDPARAGFAANDTVVLNADFVYNSANVTEARTISAGAWDISGADAANYNLASFTPVSGAITARPVDAVWCDSAPYYCNGVDQGATVSASYIDVNGQTMTLRVGFSGRDCVFRESGNYVARAESADANYAVSEATVLHSYTMNPVQESPVRELPVQVAPVKDMPIPSAGLNPNFDATVPAILGNALVRGAATSPTGGNLYTAPYSTLISATDLRVRDGEVERGGRGYVRFRADHGADYIFIPEESKNASIFGKSAVFSIRTDLDNNPRMCRSVSGETDLVNEAGLVSGHELFPDGIDTRGTHNIPFDWNAEEADVINFRGADNGRRYEFMRQPVRMPGTFFPDGEAAEEMLFPPGYDLAGLPPVDSPHKLDRFKSELENLLDEMLVTA